MRALDDIRTRAREVRAECAPHPEGILQGLFSYLKTRHGITIAPESAEAMEGSEAEIEHPFLRYDERLSQTPAALLYQLAHEAGHLEFHPRVKRRSYRSNPIAAAIYLRQQDVGAVAMYSPKLPEEVEAVAFANEFVCPADEALALWRSTPGLTVREVAAHFEASQSVAEVQLVEALYREALGTASGISEVTTRPRKEDPSQNTAVAYTSGSALIKAGPGTGKTSTLVRHALYLLTAPQTVGDNLLVLTFSNEAAEELRARLRHALAAREDVKPDRIQVFTFHGFGLYLIHLFHDRLGFDEPPAVLDEVGQEELLLSAFASANARTIFNLKDPEGAAEDAARHVNHLKQRLRTPDWLRARLDKIERVSSDVGDLVEVAPGRALADLWERYEAEKAAAGRVDFADLIALPTRLLASDGDAAALVRRQYQVALVDEYQDVSAATGALLRAVCIDGDAVAVPAWVVGDAHQAIYGFLGADPSNVTDFLAAFPGSREFSLDQSYRSCAPIIEAANELAMLMDWPEHDGPPERMLKHNPEVEPLGDRPIHIAVAPSDAAEHQGVVEVVLRWQADGAALEDIAVLTRRNVDVREIALALSRRGVPVTTSGIVTAEGAAGDLVAALTIADAPGASLPRLAYSLGDEGLTPPERNAITAQLLSQLEASKRLGAVEGSASERALAAEIKTAYERMKEEQYRSDAFGASVVFLFEASDYLRRLLVRRDAATTTDERAVSDLALAEVATTLGRASAYRFSHPDTPPREARLHFAAHFRRALGGAMTSAIAPRRTPGLVRVMTCHAAKGLEFPLVAVAGQRVVTRPRDLGWLPANLIQGGQDPSAQDDALLFVAVTRAERAVHVSYSRSAGGTTATGYPPALLKKWVERYGREVEEWPAVPTEKEEVEMGPVWGGPRRTHVRTSDLAKPKESCALRGYVDRGLGLSFPDPTPGLYGPFTGCMRSVLGEIVEAAHSGPVTRATALEMLEEHWPPEGLEDHPHLALYSRAAQDAIVSFADAFAAVGLPLPPEPTPLDLEAVCSEYGLDLRFGLASDFRDGRGRPTVVLFHAGSLTKYLNAKGEGVKWSASPLERDRVGIALLRAYYQGQGADLAAYVYSAADGDLYPFVWPAERYFGPELERASGQVRAFAARRYEHTVSESQCDRCRSRVICPHRIGALNGDRVVVR